MDRLVLFYAAQICLQLAYGNAKGSWECGDCVQEEVKQVFRVSRVVICLVVVNCDLGCLAFCECITNDAYAVMGVFGEGLCGLRGLQAQVGETLVPELFAQASPVFCCMVFQKGIVLAGDCFCYDGSLLFDIDPCRLGGIDGYPERYPFLFFALDFGRVQVTGVLVREPCHDKPSYKGQEGEDGQRFTCC